jgi:PBP1b-binding outer membrane lipoprotein LpoB
MKRGLVALLLTSIFLMGCSEQVTEQMKSPEPVQTTQPIVQQTQQIEEDQELQNMTQDLQEIETIFNELQEIETVLSELQES